MPTDVELLAVFIRSKIAKGHTYYQIVEGVRTGDRVRQRIVMALGSTPDPAAALQNMKRELARLRRDRGRWPPGYKPELRTLARRLERLDARIVEMETRVETLAGLIKSKSIGTTPKRGEG